MVRALALASAGLFLILNSNLARATITAQAAASISLAEYDHLDPKNLIPDKPLRQALTYFSTNKDKFPNPNWIAVIDFTKHSSSRRFFLVNMTTGEVETYLTTHGRGSDQWNSGYAKSFSNDDGSWKTSLGFYRTAEVYSGKFGRSLRLDGLSSTNSNVRMRDIVIHAADYVDESAGTAGRTLGCIAFDHKVKDRIIDVIKSGAMLYAWAE